MQDKIVSYLMADNFIKKNIVSSIPDETNFYDEHALMKYGDQLSDILNQIQYLFLKIDKDFNLGLHDYIINLFNKYQDKVITASNDYEKMEQVYKEIFANDRESFTEQVNSEFYGYSTQNKLDTLKKAESIDELLHAIHRYIITNEKVYKSLPIIASRELENGEAINLYNNDLVLGKQIFNNFPLKLNIGETSILNINDNHVLMMIRDVGHALTIDINKDDKYYHINYFIPKICNYLMVNQLPGVDLVKQSSKYARGNYTVTESTLLFNIYNLIQNVPTDDDMYKIGGKLYQETSFKR